MTSPVSVVLVFFMLCVTCLAQRAPCDKKNYCVGAAKSEITAPPGFPTGGHGPAGGIARGSWGRNWARAFVIRDQVGAVAVLVSCDTFAVPLSLTKHVWETVENKLERKDLKLKPEGLLISATHTHQGPGNYFDSPAYNAFGSARLGFSRPLFNFLVKQISDAILRAADNMHVSELRLYQGTVQAGFDKPFLVNRSPATFAQNWNAATVLSELGFKGDKACPEKRLPGEPEDGWDLGGCPRLRAVDRRMLILEATDVDSKERLADLVFFAVHPTVLIHHAPLFSSDFTGYAMDALEHDKRGLVAGFFNGAEGDITARRFHRDALEVVERGEQFLAAAKNLLAKREKVDLLDPRISLSARLIDTGSSSDRQCREGDITYRLARTPLVGAAQPGGGELDRTIFFDFGWRTGVRSLTATEDQGNKQPALDLKDIPGFSLLTSILGGPLAFPRRLPVTYLKLGKFSLGALPFEVSTTAGYRIRKNMETADEVFQLLGLTNGYASYLATASEYAAQDYMGASTLWGPNEADFFRCQLMDLKGKEPKEKFRFPLIVLDLSDDFKSSIVGYKRDLPDEDLEEIIRDDAGMPVRHLPFFEWTERVQDQYIAASRRRVSVTTVANDIVDDTDFGFIKILKQKPDGECQVWNAIWLGPLLKKVAAIDYVFHVTSATGEEIVSTPFKVNLDSPDKPHPVDALKKQEKCK
jgi:neutral ceramidase